MFISARKAELLQKVVSLSLRKWSTLNPLCTFLTQNAQTEKMADYSFKLNRNQAIV